MLRFVFIIVIFTRNMKFYTLQKFPTIQYNTCTLSYFAAFLCFSINIIAMLQVSGVLTHWHIL